MWRFGDCGGRADRKAGEGSEFDEALGVAGGRTIYDAVVGNVHIGIIGGIEDAKALDDLGMSDVLCTSSVRAVREIEPKVVIAMGNVDGMVTDLKLTPRAEKKFKLKTARRCQWRWKWWRWRHSNSMFDVSVFVWKVAK